jgi:hypothetical protein
MKKILALLLVMVFAGCSSMETHDLELAAGFKNPPDSARPGVYWYFMDGNLSGEGMTADLESMKEVGLGNLVFLEVNIGVPRGPVDFMSEKWQDLFVHAVRESERLGIDITLGSGPGWTGSGGPWVKPEQAMQHLLTSVTEAKGPAKFDAVLPMPAQHPTPWGKMKTDFYEDVVTYAFPKTPAVISDINEKALYDRYPYTSWKKGGGVKEYLPAPAKFDEPGAESVISPGDIIDISKYLDSDGRLRWDVPDGEWTIIRMVRRATCASTRPAPKPGVGLECDKFDTAALDYHFANYYGKLLKKVGPRKGKNGWKAVHIDSWEMGAQNWTKNFLAEFKRRRGYDAKPYLLAYSGRAVSSLEISERFLWDVRMTCQELVLENHAGHLKKLGHKNGFELSIEPYDMSPTSDLDLGAVADVPMCEFWSAGYGFKSAFSCIEATSIAHTMGRPIVSSEAFTGVTQWQQYPWSMKNQGDWAFCMGVNRFVYHTFAHKPLGDEHRPGMQMGPYGVHWDRGQTWWPMVSDYHKYVTRCSNLLRHGVTVSDILYLTPEGAPHVFRAPESALAKSDMEGWDDKKGYGFDGCSPNILMARAKVRKGKIEFDGGTSYSVMVLPRFETMTPKLLAKIEKLVKTGATVIGSPPVKSPSLVDYPQCDDKVKKLAKKLWGSLEAPSEITERKYGRGVIYFGGEKPEGLYPEYDSTVSILKEMGISDDFTSTGAVRYGHRTTKDRDIYFVSNKTAEPIQVDCTFRVSKSKPQLWNPVTGEMRALPQYKTQDGLTTIPMEFVPYESFFVIFPRKASKVPAIANVNFPAVKPVATIEGAWEVSFDPKWGGPAKITFDTLYDWTSSKERGIKYYSGIATYKKSFDAFDLSGKKIYLDLGTVHDMARVTLNGKDLGVVWCAPWHVDITDVVKATGNVLEIEVANRWPNRLLGDQQPPDKDVRTVKWDSGFLEGKEYKTGRYTFTTGRGPGKLLPSGLIGPVQLMTRDKN